VRLRCAGLNAQGDDADTIIPLNSAHQQRTPKGHSLSNAATRLSSRCPSPAFFDLFATYSAQGRWRISPMKATRKKLKHRQVAGATGSPLPCTAHRASAGPVRARVSIPGTGRAKRTIASITGFTRSGNRRDRAGQGVLPIWMTRSGTGGACSAVTRRRATPNRLAEYLAASRAKISSREVLPRYAGHDEDQRSRGLTTARMDPSSAMLLNAENGDCPQRYRVHGAEGRAFLTQSVQPKGRRPDAAITHRHRHGARRCPISEEETALLDRITHRNR